MGQISTRETVRVEKGKTVLSRMDTNGDEVLSAKVMKNGGIWR